LFLLSPPFLLPHTNPAALLSKACTLYRSQELRACTWITLNGNGTLARKSDPRLEGSGLLTAF
jgi:hypothetical protein